MLYQDQLSSSPASSPIIHTPETDWAFDTFDDSDSSLWDDARSRQVRTPENCDVEPRLPSIKSKRVGIFSQRELKDKGSQLGSLFRQAHEKILAHAQDITTESSSTSPAPASTTTQTHGAASHAQDIMASPETASSPIQTGVASTYPSSIQDSLGCITQSDIDAWCTLESNHLFQTSQNELAEEWPDFKHGLPAPPKQHQDLSAPSYQVPPTLPQTEPIPMAYPRFNFERGPASHRCSKSRHAGSFGCADMRVQIVHIASHQNSPHDIPCHFQGVIDLQVCDRAMANYIPGWNALKYERSFDLCEPVPIYVSSDIDTVKFSTKWLLDQIHYPTTEASVEYLDMQTLSSVVELTTQFGGAGPRIDGCIRWALLNAEVSSLEDVLFGLCISTLDCNNDLFYMFRDVLALNYTGEDIAASLQSLSSAVPYLAYKLSDEVCSLYDIRRNIIHEVLQAVERAIDETWKQPINVTRFHFLCALKYRFMSPMSLENDTFDLCGLMQFMREVVFINKEPYMELFDELRCAFANHGVQSNFTPFVHAHHTQQYY